MTEHSLAPAGFFGHGSPMNALEHNRYTDAWRAFGACVDRPRAVVVISAHWYTQWSVASVRVTTRANLRSACRRHRRRALLSQ
jgi:4,5-DOPA dioxygenase extradiol